MPYSPEILRTQRIIWETQFFWFKRIGFCRGVSELHFEMSNDPFFIEMFAKDFSNPSLSLITLLQKVILFLQKRILPYYSLSSEDFSAIWHFTKLIALLEKIGYLLFLYFSYVNILIFPYLQCIAVFNMIKRLLH